MLQLCKVNLKLKPILKTNSSAECNFILTSTSEAIYILCFTQETAKSFVSEPYCALHINYKAPPLNKLDRETCQTGHGEEISFCIL